MTGLTTHILDTARGLPGAGVRVEVFSVEAESRTRLNSAVTNDDGRIDSPLLDGASLRPGIYEIDFHIGEYFADWASPPAFLDRVTVRFGVAKAGGHYHIPLLVSPYGYTTYRGS